MVFHFCTLHEKLNYTLPVFILLIFLSFYNMLSRTANNYLPSSFTIISDKFGLSKNISALTLLAFGNLAPDYFYKCFRNNLGYSLRNMSLPNK